MILANVIGCHKNFCQDEFRTRFREIKTLIGLFSNAVSITSRFHCVSGHWGHALLSSSSHIFFFSLLHLLLSSMSSSTSPATPPSLHVFTCSLWPVSPVTGPLFFSTSHRLHLHLTSTPSLHHCRLLISYRMLTQLFEMYYVVFIFSLFEMSYKISLLLPKNSAKFIVLFLFSACLKYHIRSHTVCLNNCLKCTM